MAKKKKKKQTKAAKQKREYHTFLLMGIVLLLFGIFGLLKLGLLGILMANVFRFLVGDTYPVLAVVLLLYGILLIILGKEPKFKKKRLWIGGLVFYLGLLLFLHARLFSGVEGNYLSLTWQKLFTDIRGNVVSQAVGGGMIGGLIYSATHFLVSQLGSYILAFLFLFVGLFLASNLKWSQAIQWLDHTVGKWKEKNRANQELRQQRKQEKAAQQKIATEQAAQAEQEAAEKNNVRPFTPGEKLAKSEIHEQAEITGQEAEQLKLEIDSYQNKYEMKQEKTHEKEQEAEDLTDEELDFEIPEEAEDRDYQLPSSSLLNEIPLTDQSGEYQSIEKNVHVLEKTFKSFGVDAKVVRASLGPSVTKYEIQPAVGVKVSKIVNLTDDLALALAAKDIRMEAPIPGKSLIGIEVPNGTVSTVSFRDIVEAQSPHPDKLLEVPLGRDISGSVISADLSKMPHMLIAGSTGSGKSVCINGIITSILMNAKPNEVKLMMVDPKMVELNVYNGIPHLLTPVVTNPRRAAQALQKVVQEMERRYELFAGTAVRNITGYNEFIIRKNMEDGENRPILPFIVVVVDELADLMMVASNEVEDAITRLAQMARAAGIHMILATQRPSVDVITGIIKANVPSRIAFAVSSGTDSRTIIDSNGAEKLLGRGDMLFLPMGENKPIRVQGAFISDQEVERVVEYITNQQGADYQESMMPAEEKEIGVESSQDDFYEDALLLIVEMQTASISLLQRRFRIGYNRAARLIDEMEMNGIIGPSEGSKPRKVLLQQLPSNEPSDGEE